MDVLSFWLMNWLKGRKNYRLKSILIFMKVLVFNIWWWLLMIFWKLLLICVYVELSFFLFFCKFIMMLFLSVWRVICLNLRRILRSCKNLELWLMLMKKGICFRFLLSWWKIVLFCFLRLFSVWVWKDLVLGILKFFLNLLRENRKNVECFKNLLIKVKIVLYMWGSFFIWVFLIVDWWRFDYFVVCWWILFLLLWCDVGLWFVKVCCLSVWYMMMFFGWKEYEL